jgi:hypothetical protein
VLLPFVVVPSALSILAQCNELKRRNFRNQLVVTACGVAIFASFVLQLDLVSLMWTHISNGCAVLAFVGVWFLLLGLVDDTFGDGKWRGFKGHFGALFLEGRITSGLLKAVGGLLCSVIAVLWFGGGCSFTSLVVGVALICSSANGINLLDKRPSRAIKAFWMLCAVSIVFSRHELRMLPFMLILSTLPYSYYDFTSKAMLGDAGSNMLGAILGAFIWLATAVPFQIAILLIWLGLHVYSEKHSLTEAIAKVRLLRWIDELGVR